MTAHIEPHQFARSALNFNLYPWQAETLAAAGKTMPVALLAPNGSGKSSLVITSFILWFLSEFPAGRAIVTSGSWQQLRSQIFDNLRTFSDHPLFQGWEFQESMIRTPQSGWAMGVSVDDPLKLEGHHKRPGSPVAIVVDEAKSVSDGNFDSIGKCSPTYRLICSSAGIAAGKLYRIFTTESDYWFRRRVTWKECPHINLVQLDIDRDLCVNGEDSVFFKNKYLSEFASDDGQSVISLDSLRALLANPPPYQSGSPTGFVDFSAGGDATVFALSTGNKIEIVDSWRSKDTMYSIGRLISHFKRLRLEGWQIAGDSGGLGYVMLDRLQEEGWTLRRINNNNPASRPDAFVNIASEWWNNFALLVQRQQVIIPANNEKLIHELTNRNLSYDSKGRIGLESKEEMRNRGLNSPDLGESAIGACMCGWGSLPSTLRPAGDKAFLEALAVCNYRMERNRSMFYTPYVRF